MTILYRKVIDAKRTQLKKESLPVKDCLVAIDLWAKKVPAVNYNQAPQKSADRRLRGFDESLYNIVDGAGHYGM